MALTTAQRQKLHRDKVRAMKRIKTVQDLLKDIDVKVTLTDHGTVKIVWDMDVESEAILEAYCAGQGIDLDTLLQDVQLEVLARWTLKAKQGGK